MTPSREAYAGISQEAPTLPGPAGTPVQALLDAAATTHAGSVLRRAYAVAAACHEGQLRLSGDAYITHPVEVAKICQNLGTSPDVWCAALLHDVLADTAYTADQLHRDFGDEIAGLVEEVTRLDRSNYQSTVEALDRAQSVNDPRVLVIKLADRLHNMRTLSYIPPVKQQLKSREALECFAPIARGLGLDAVARELADLAHQTLGQDREEQASLAARERASASVISHRVLAITAVLLPKSGRHRWLSEWTAELAVLPTRRRRARFTIEMLVGMPRLAAVLRHQVTSTGRRSDRLLPASSHHGHAPAAPSNLTLGGKS